MAEKEVLVLCYWNGCIKYGPDGVYYEGSAPKKIGVKEKTEFARLLNGLYIITGFDKQRSKLEIIGRYPVVVSPNLFRYVHLPVVNDRSLETMLELPSIHPSINSVELYLEVKPASVDVIDPPAACSSPLASSKGQRTQQPQEASYYYVDKMNVRHPVIKLEIDDGLEVQGVDNNNGWIEAEANADFGNGCTHGDEVGEMTGLEASVTKGVSSSASEPLSLSSLWVDDHELRVGMCFKNRDELKKTVDWCSIRGQQKCVVQETNKDEYTFECVRWKCKWSLRASRMEEHGLVEITSCSGPHTCCPIKPEKFELEFAAEEIEFLIMVQPTLTLAELDRWWCENFGYELGTAQMQAAKQEAIRKVYGDWDQSLRLLPKLMAALHSSNGLVLDWQYDAFPNPEFAYFRGVFWAFPQSIEGFAHCRPLIVVDTKRLKGKYPMTLMIASGLDGDDYYFPLAFAVTTEVSSDAWRWFLTNIKEKVTQRKGLCLISSPHPDIVAVINEPGSLWQEPWAYHRFCLDRLISQFDGVFRNCRLKSLVKQAGSTKHQDEFDSLMKTIKKANPEARRWLDQMPPHQWALAHDGGRRCGIINIKTENLFSVCEGFFSLGLPVTAGALLLFDELRLSFHLSLCDSRGRLNRGDVYTRRVMDKLEEFREASVTYVVMQLDNNAFRVSEPLENDEEWIVQLSECTCTCGKFQRKKFPCLHALAVCEKLKVNPLQYVDDCLTLERLNKTYSATFFSVPEVSAWPEASGVPTLFRPFFPPPTPTTHVSGKRKKSETSPKVSSKRKKTEKVTKEPSKSSSKEKPAKELSNSSSKGKPAKELSNSSSKGKPTKEQSKSSSKGKPTKEQSKSSSKGKPAKEQSKSSSKEKPVKGKGKDKTKKPPSDQELRNAIPDILRGVDFGTVTMIDIVHRLAKKFKVDLTPRKKSIKVMIQEEIRKIADEDKDEEVVMCK